MTYYISPLLHFHISFFYKDLLTFMGDLNVRDDELAQLARLSLTGGSQDVRLFLARLVRKHRQDNPQLSNILNSYLKQEPGARSGVFREIKNEENSKPQGNNLNLEKPAFLTNIIDSTSRVRPILSSSLEKDLSLLIQERRESGKLISAGLRPSSSAFFIGKPGVGKTITAKWLASELRLPLYVLDLALIMGSYLGQTGINIKNALDYAKSTSCVLLLDEIDALVKTRGDDTDIGEIKRVVTVMLQEIENWNPRSILIAATNHPELVDHAIWRRFDLVFKFEPPEQEQIYQSIKYFFDKDYSSFKKYEKALSILYMGSSFSDIQRSIWRIRRMYTLGNYSIPEILIEVFNSPIQERRDRLEFAKALTETGDFSQHFISQITGVSRDTLRKYSLLKVSEV
jgi:SpoVK/Ycf46/Vps4 family AAA+-type ATPase